MYGYQPKPMDGEKVYDGSIMYLYRGGEWILHGIWRTNQDRPGQIWLEAVRRNFRVVNGSAIVLPVQSAPAK